MIQIEDLGLPMAQPFVVPKQDTPPSARAAYTPARPSLAALPQGRFAPRSQTPAQPAVDTSTQGSLTPSPTGMLSRLSTTKPPATQAPAVQVGPTLTAGEVVSNGTNLIGSAFAKLGMVGSKSVLAAKLTQAQATVEPPKQTSGGGGGGGGGGAPPSEAEPTPASTDTTFPELKLPDAQVMSASGEWYKTWKGGAVLAAALAAGYYFYRRAQR